MIDNVTLSKAFKPPSQLHRAHGMPFDYKGVTYYPNYKRGELRSYVGHIKNLRVYMHPEKIFLLNSLHKFYHGCNYNDFFVNELEATLDTLSGLTGVNWFDAMVNKIEYGCNIETNSMSLINSLINYKSKDYLPMISRGKKYGSSCEFDQYRVKGYDKAFQVMAADKIKLKKQVFRWEIQITSPKYFARFKPSHPLNAGSLIMPEFLSAMANDAVTIYKNSIKMQTLQLSKLSTHEKRVLATMLNAEIREDIKHHNKDTYKRDRRIYKRIMADKSICIDDATGELLEEKFKQLIEGIRSDEKQMIENVNSSL